MLRVYLAALIDGDPQPRENRDELRWLAATQLDDMPMLPADRPLLPAVHQQL
jgi:8-oxo-dGTP diphosphatase